MKLSESIKPISYLKAHASEIIRNLGKECKSMIITQNGEAKAVLMDIHQYEQLQDSLAMSKILAQSTISLEEGKTKPFRQAFQDLRQKIKDQKVP